MDEHAPAPGLCCNYCIVGVGPAGTYSLTCSTSTAVDVRKKNERTANKSTVARRNKSTVARRNKSTVVFRVWIPRCAQRTQQKKHQPAHEHKLVLRVGELGYTACTCEYVKLPAPVAGSSHSTWHEASTTRTTTAPPLFAIATWRVYSSDEVIVHGT